MSLLRPDPPPQLNLKILKSNSANWSEFTNLKTSISTSSYFWLNMGLKCSRKGLKFKNFSGGHAPRPPRDNSVLS